MYKIPENARTITKWGKFQKYVKCFKKFVKVHVITNQYRQSQGSEKKVVETKVARKEFMNTCTKFGFDTYIRF